jgi:hypothetical protein
MCQAPCSAAFPHPQQLSHVRMFLSPLEKERNEGKRFNWLTQCRALAMADLEGSPLPNTKRFLLQGEQVGHHGWQSEWICRRKESVLCFTSSVFSVKAV